MPDSNFASNNTASSNNTPSNDTASNDTASSNNTASIVLVGNGTSVLDRQLGEKIDEFDRVVRFNSFKINGFERFVGRKTTDWFNVQYFPNKNFRFEKKYQKYVFHSWLFERREEKFIEMEKNIVSDEKLVVTGETLREIVDFSGDKSYKWYSTGAIAAWLLLKEFERLHLYGFDWWDRLNHHYGDHEVRGNIHDPRKELLFFQKLKDRVIFL